MTGKDSRQRQPAAPDIAGKARRPGVFRVGVTGHRQLTDSAALAVAIHEAIDELTRRLAGADAQPSLHVISALAEGADRLVASVVLAIPGAELEAVLPMPAEEYLADFPSEASRAEFTGLLRQACDVWLAPASSSREEGYERAGRHIVERSDALVALWDGKPPRGPGGTATIVAYAQDQQVPLAWIDTTRNPPAVSYWLADA